MYTILKKLEHICFDIQHLQCCRHFYYPDNLGYTDTRTSVSAQHYLDNRGRTVIDSNDSNGTIIILSIKLLDNNIKY